MHPKFAQSLTLAILKNFPGSEDAAEAVLRLLRCEIQYRFCELRGDLTAHDLSWWDEADFKGQEGAALELDAGHVRELKRAITGTLEVLGDGDFGCGVARCEAGAGSAYSGQLIEGTSGAEWLPVWANGADSGANESLRQAYVKEISPAAMKEALEPLAVALLERTTAGNRAKGTDVALILAKDLKAHRNERARLKEDHQRQSRLDRHEVTLNMVPVEMSTLMTIWPGAGRTDWKYPRQRTNPAPRSIVRPLRRTYHLTFAQELTLGLTVGEE